MTEEGVIGVFQGQFHENKYTYHFSFGQCSISPHSSVCSGFSTVNETKLAATFIPIGGLYRSVFYLIWIGLALEVKQGCIQPVRVGEK